MVFINTNDTIGILLVYLTNNITGHIFLTLLLITMCFIAVGMLFRMPIEATTILVFPFLLVSTAYTTTFYPVLGVAILYMAIVFTVGNPLGR